MTSGTWSGSAGRMKLLFNCRDWYHSQTPLLFSTGSVFSSYLPIETLNHLTPVHAHTNRPTDITTGIPIDRHREIDRQTDRQAGRQADR